MMAVVALGDLEEVERTVYRNLLKSNRAKTLRAEVQDGIQNMAKSLRRIMATSTLMKSTDADIKR
jgi:meiotically up-regulated gene 157 (Mug157) protein